MSVVRLTMAWNGCWRDDEWKRLRWRVGDKECGV